MCKNGVADIDTIPKWRPFVQSSMKQKPVKNQSYQELKSNESKNEREEKKGLKNKKKELNDTAS